MGEIGRLLTAMVTPFDSNGEVDYVQAKILANALIVSGSDGLVVAGTTGEAPTLSHEEKLRLFSEVKLAVGDKAAVIAGTSNYNTAESIEFTREAEAIGVDGALLTVPYYNKPTQEGLYQHFKSIAESTALSCIVYNVPSRTVTDMTAETTIRLSHISNIIGVKEASGNMEQIAHIIGGTDNEFRVWSGNDSDTFLVMSMGGFGVISVASHIVGIQIKNMMNNIVASKLTSAAKEHIRLMDMFTGLFVISNPMPVKYAVNMAGISVGESRLPLLPLDNKTEVFVKDLIGSYSVDLTA